MANTLEFLTGEGISAVANTTARTITLAGKDATSTQKGITRLATDAEMAAGSITTAVPSVKQVKDAISSFPSPETAATIKTKYESNSNTNAFTDALLAKLNGITTGATAETAVTIKTKYESNSDTNAFTDAYKAKLDGLDATINDILTQISDLTTQINNLNVTNSNPITISQTDITPGNTALATDSIYLVYDI